MKTLVNFCYTLFQVLVNVAPPKPVRTLTEDERQNLLNNRTPSVDSVLDPGQVNVFVHPEVAIQQQGACPLPIYDMSNYHTENEYSVDAEGNLVITKNKPKMTLNLNENKDAPLASPETLSDRSSLASSSSLKNITSSNRDSLRKSLQSPLETIQQSPTVKTPSNGTVFDIPVVRIESNSNNPSETTNTVSESCDQDSPDQSTFNTRTESESEDQSYERHSPVEMNQSEYGNPNSYYSAAGLGYPHFVGEANEDDLEYMSEGSETSETNRMLEEESRHAHPPLKISHSECSKLQKKLLHSSQSDSYIQTLSEKYVMRRSKEQGDIAHLQDVNNVFEIDDLIPVHDVNCNHNCVCSHGQRNGSHGSISGEEDSELRLSTSHSDDIFDLPIEETDV